MEFFGLDLTMDYIGLIQRMIRFKNIQRINPLIFKRILNASFVSSSPRQVVTGTYQPVKELRFLIHSNHFHLRYSDLSGP